jgi:signal transduction histidine kinase
VTPRQEVFRLEPIIERTWRALRAVVRSIVLPVQGPPVLLVAEVDRQVQVLWALLDNAVKYSSPRSPVVVEVSVQPSESGELRAEVAVVDRGPGMDPETVGHAFEQFYRATSARRDAPDGSGIGLYAARGLIEAMGGSIAITSPTGGGTRVAFGLPAEGVEEPVAVPTSVNPDQM